MKNETTALLVIDMQQVGFDGEITPAITNGAEVLNSVSTLIDLCRTHNVRVIYLQTRASSGRPYAEDAHGWEIHPQVAPAADESILFKVGPSAFENPGLDKTLRETGIEAVIVCGTWSDGCVKFSCRAALELGYQLCLATDAHGTVRATAAEAAAAVDAQNQAFAPNTASITAIAQQLAST